MTNEIKEILDFDFESQGERIEINEYERDILKDYITNLQEELDRCVKANVILDNENTDLQGKITNLQEENQALKNQLDFIEEQNHIIDKLEKENERLNNVINELEKLIDSYELGKYDYEIPVFILKDKLKELKEGK